uniref:Uncharacterized protein n=1 Tax=Rhizophora mucronata TaxID=61149 RepID=A0A2P2P8C8_RHIMU
MPNIKGLCPNKKHRNLKHKLLPLLVIRAFY